MQQRSFETVVADHGATVLRVCLAVLGPTEAEDAWSETFLSAMQAYPELPADANVEAWLVTIAHRKAIDVVRSAARRALPVEQVQDTTPAPSADSRDLDLVTAMRLLPPKQKQAVAYHYLAGLPYSEIAVIVGGTADAARRAAADGIAALRRSYPAVVDHDGATSARSASNCRSSDARSSTRGVSR
jgi:RNA polymerase sigma factor (sigma-70 family)